VGSAKLEELKGIYRKIQAIDREGESLLDATDPEKVSRRIMLAYDIRGWRRTFRARCWTYQIPPEEVKQAVHQEDHPQPLM
jgi:hypothetical protein